MQRDFLHMGLFAYEAFMMCLGYRNFSLGVISNLLFYIKFKKIEVYHRSIWYFTGLQTRNLHIKNHKSGTPNFLGFWYIFLNLDSFKIEVL